MFFLLDISKNGSYYKIVLKKKQFDNKKKQLPKLLKTYFYDTGGNNDEKIFRSSYTHLESGKHLRIRFGTIHNS